jgi:SanA protein
MKRLFRFLLLTSLGAGILLGVAHWRVSHTAHGRVYDDIQTVPTKRVALVLGCARVLANGRENLFFQYRIDAAAALFHAGKVTHLLVSGDNRRDNYNEPREMRAALLKKGVPENRITCDYAGLRTLDSVVRAQTIFGQTDYLIVSQRRHAERAIYLARSHGQNVVAFAAAEPPARLAFKTEVRETVARLAAVVDVEILHTEPKHGGKPEPL